MEWLVVIRLIGSIRVETMQEWIDNIAASDIFAP